MTEVGARLAIQHLPKLVDFDCSFSLQAILNLQQTQVDADISQQPQGVRRYLLSDLRCGAWDEDTALHSWQHVRGGLPAALQLCPFVIRVEMSGIEGLNDQDLKALKALDNLRHLVLESLFSTRSLTFEGGLQPVLEKFGPASLESLYLGDFNSEIDICALLQHCSNLRSLHLFQLEFIDPHISIGNQPKVWLPHLETLAIYEIWEVPKNVLSLLFRSAPALVSLNLCNVENLTDDLFEEAILLYGFPKLKELFLGCCPNVTERSIDLFLTLDNPLSKITLDCCKKLRDDDVWDGPIQDKNLDLILDLTWI